MLCKEGRVTQEEPQVQRTAAELNLAGINLKTAKKWKQHKSRQGHKVRNSSP